MLKESQMAFLLNNDSIKATQARQKILLFTLSRLDHFKITTIVQARTSLDKHVKVVVFD
jgi:hypothetical protein